MHGLLSYYLDKGISMINDMKSENSQWEQRIIKDWDNSKALPRKKKKKARKGIMAEWSICQWGKKELTSYDFNDLF